MQMAFERVGDVAVAPVPVEELDASNAAEFKRDIAPLLEANAKLVLDLSRLRFVDSSGLGAFISCLRKLNAKGGDLTWGYPLSYEAHAFLTYKLENINITTGSGALATFGATTTPIQSASVANLFRGGVTSSIRASRRPTCSGRRKTSST